MFADAKLSVYKHTQFLKYKSMKKLHLIRFQLPLWQMQRWSSKVNLWSPALSKQQRIELYQIITIFVVQSRRSIPIRLWHQMDVQKRQNLLQRKKILLDSKKNVGCFFFELPIHKACEGVFCRHSSGFSSRLKPINDGITIEGKPSKRPVFKGMRFRTIAAKLWNSCDFHFPINHFWIHLFLFYFTWGK